MRTLHTYYQISISILICFIINISHSASAQVLPPDAFGNFLNALVVAKDSMDSFFALEKAARDIVAGKKPSMNTKWAKVADTFEEAEARIRKLPLPFELMEFGDLDFNAWWAFHKSCRTRGALYMDRHSSLNHNRAGRKKLIELIGRVEAHRAQIERVDNAMDSLIELHSKLIAMPLYGNQFLPYWFDLENRMLPAVGGLKDALRSQHTKLKTFLAKVDSTINADLGTINALDNLVPTCVNEKWWSYEMSLRDR